MLTGQLVGTGPEMGGVGEGDGDGSRVKVGGGLDRPILGLLGKTHPVKTTSMSTRAIKVVNDRVSMALSSPPECLSWMLLRYERLHHLRHPYDDR